ncbi:MAG: hypothetical protein V3U71_03120 [Cocleimonas sp.]
MAPPYYLEDCFSKRHKHWKVYRYISEGSVDVGRDLSALRKENDPKIKPTRYLMLHLRIIGRLFFIFPLLDKYLRITKGYYVI